MCDWIHSTEHKTILILNVLFFFTNFPADTGSAGNLFQSLHQLFSRVSTLERHSLPRFNLRTSVVPQLVSLIMPLVKLERNRCFPSAGFDHRSLFRGVLL